MKIFIPAPLRQFAGTRSAVEVSAKTVGEALGMLVAEHPDLKRHLYAEDGKLRAFINVYLNDEDIRYLDKDATLVEEGDTLSIVPSIAGGTIALSQDEILRYSRHLVMPEVGLEGQGRLKSSRILCVGAGGLGSPLALYLAAAGVGTIGIVDFDVVDATNLQRQVLYSTADVGRKKLDSAVERLRGLNPFLEIRPFETRLSSENALDIVRQFDLVVDGTDNFATRYLVNDACVLCEKPNVYGSIFRFEGQLSVFALREGPCYRCLHPEPPPPGLVPSCAEGGVLGILPGLVGVMQATEALKLALGRGEPLVGRLLLIDALQMRFRELRLRKDPNCPVCGSHPTIRRLIDYEQFCGSRSEAATRIPEVSVEELKLELDAGRDLYLLDVREPQEYQICNLGGHLIPVGELPRRMHELDPSRDIVAHCRSGGRSARAVEFLRRSGFGKVRNLVGGIRAWAERIDRGMPRY
ncbi:MAG TPA: ubiquitin-like small modifier protein 1 [Anaeromyxobacteraceae bacterium]|nr:ubiquitin-like small modifier protein 1 [Anaeromyxobacteraceae bacterium]